MDADFIDTVLDDKFFNKFSRKNEEPLKEKVFEELKDAYGYPKY